MKKEEKKQEKKQETQEMPKPAKRYESDMTWKEKRQFEKEKLKSLHGKEKWTYILEYYKLHIIGLAILIFVIVMAVQWVQNLKNEDILTVTVIDSTMTDTDELSDEIKAYLGDEIDYHFVIFDTSIYFSDDSSMDYTNTMKLAAYIAAGSMDVMICDDELYQSYVEQEGFLDLKETLGDDLYEAVSEYVTDDGYAIDISENQKWADTGLTYYEPVYLTIVSTSPYPENAAKFVAWLFDYEG